MRYADTPGCSRRRAPRRGPPARHGRSTRQRGDRGVARDDVRAPRRAVPQDEPARVCGASAPALRRNPSYVNETFGALRSSADSVACRSSAAGEAEQAGEDVVREGFALGVVLHHRVVERLAGERDLVLGAGELLLQRRARSGSPSGPGSCSNTASRRPSAPPSAPSACARPRIAAGSPGAAAAAPARRSPRRRGP